MSATILHGDCLQVMRDLSDSSVDCFICDLPYGCLSSVGNKKASCSWDIKIDLVEFWKQVKRLAKNDHVPVLMFCNTKFGAELIASNPPWFRYDLVWNKQFGVSFLSANKMPMRSHEMIYVFSKKGAYYQRVDVKVEGKVAYTPIGGGKGVSAHYGADRGDRSGKAFGEGGMRAPLSVINVKSKVNTAREARHPTEKPHALYEWLLTRYCPAGGTVLDPTAGSFNSVEVAQRLGLHGIGIEMDPTFFANAQTRLGYADQIRHIE